MKQIHRCTFGKMCGFDKKPASRQTLATEPSKLGASSRSGLKSPNLSQRQKARLAV